jgi:3-hydroxymyristoyl/3-hydroxydecanoyl-(acyl carrier protein) dehydratase
MNNKKVGLHINQSSIMRQSQGFSFDWKLEKDFSFLEGHFPNKPLLPAVSLLDLCLSGLKAAYPERNIQMSSITNAKYMELIEPGHQLAFQFEPKNDEQSSWSIQIFNKETGKTVSIIKLELFT